MSEQLLAPPEFAVAGGEDDEEDLHRHVGVGEGLVTLSSWYGRTRCSHCSVEVKDFPLVLEVV